MTEKEIVNALKQGNDAYLKHIYAYLPDVIRFILQNNGDEDDAKDIMQEAIMIVYNNIRSGAYQDKNLKGYLLTICKRKWLDHLDKLKRQKTQPFDTIPNVDKAEENKQFELNKPAISLGQYLEIALNKLGQPCKALINATVVLKTKMEQIAIDFGYADADSARQQKLRCLKRLKGLTSYEDIINLI